MNDFWKHISTRPLLKVTIAMSVFATVALSQQSAPLKLTQTFKLPADIKGHFDHFAVDLKGHRLLATPEEYKCVLVLDVNTGKLMHKLGPIEKPHAILYRQNLDRIYVTDGEAGDLKIFDGKTYQLLKSVKLLDDADSIGYDPATQYLYIDNGGGDVHQTYSMLSVVDTNADKKLADIKVDGETLEAMALEKSSPKLYVNNRQKNQVDIIDRKTRTTIGSWPVTKGKDNVAMALDEANHRLFVACRSGQLVVFDTESGKELKALPIAKGVDDIVYDPASKRIYAACDGFVDVYEEAGPDDYKSIGHVPSGPGAKTARLVPELKQYFVAVPQHGAESAAILVYQVD
jgi:DNA-binding beta-propeller fold protein YncE